MPKIKAKKKEEDLEDEIKLPNPDVLIPDEPVDVEVEEPDAEDEMMDADEINPFGDRWEE